MGNSQFTIRALLAVTFAAACGLALARWAVDHVPELLFFVFVACLLLFLAGFAVIVFATFAAFCIAVSETDDNRSNNLRLCCRLALIGAAAASPLGVLWCWSRFA